MSKEPTPLAASGVGEAKPALPSGGEAAGAFAAQSPASPYRKATGSHAAIAKGGTEGPAKKPALPGMAERKPNDGARAAPVLGEKPAIPSVGRRTGSVAAMPAAKIEDGAGQVNGFGGRHGAVEAQAKAPDTGPVPLPPPPGDELPIGEASGLLNLSHLKPGISGVRATPIGAGARGPVETFGGVPVTSTPPPGPNGTASAPAPVVVVAGPAPASTPGWVKYAAIAGIATTAMLAMVVVYLITRPPVVKTVEVETPSRKVNDAPIAWADPAAAAATTSQPGDPKRPAAQAKRAPSQPKPAAQPKDPNKGLSSAQRNLANLYGEADTGGPREIGAPSGPQRRAGPTNEAAVVNVVTQNKKTMSLCYERVLRHDPTLKSAKLMAHVKIGISGRVTNVSFNDAAMGSAEIGQCLSQSIKHWNFPSSDSEYEFEFPIVLQAQ
jgi:hypothetical protein